MASVAPNGNNPNFSKPQKRIDKIYPKKPQVQRAGELVTGAAAGVDDSAARRAEELAQRDQERNAQIRRRQLVYQGAIDSIETKQRSDYIGKEHFLAIYLKIAADNPEIPSDDTKPASEAFTKIVSAQYSTYHDAQTHRVIKQPDDDEPRGPLAIAIARRDEVGLGRLDKSLNRVASSMENNHGIRIGDFIDFANEYRDPKKSMPPTTNRIGAQTRQVMTMIGDYLEQHVAPVADTPD